ncbi:MAG: hypothetical protein C0594_05740 [Marinilabiliales bacterium]|nr:MAG: hypothetical protein C0594_05740 [Marinilabiliales bacterium]
MNLSKAFVIEYDTKGFIIRVNKILAKYLEKDKSEIQGQHWTKFFKSDSVNENNFWKSLINGKEAEQEFELVKGEAQIKTKGTFIPIVENGRISKIIAYSNLIN